MASIWTNIRSVHVLPSRLICDYIINIFGKDTHRHFISETSGHHFLFFFIIFIFHLIKRAAPERNRLRNSAGELRIGCGMAASDVNTDEIVISLYVYCAVRM